MITKVVDGLIQLLSQNNFKKKLFLVFLFIILVGPIILDTITSYNQLKKEMTESVYAQRESVAYLSANLLRAKFDKLIEVGKSLAEDKNFRQLVAEGKWNDAMASLANVPNDFPYFYALGLLNTNGTSMAVYPFKEGVVGSDLSYRDHYKGVSKEWRPYISTATTAASQPPYNIIGVAIPIKSKDRKPLGYIALGVKLNTLEDWSREIEGEIGSHVYFVDREGHLATDHSDFPLSDIGDIVDFSSVPAVQKVLKGESGIGVFYNPLENNEQELVAYQPVPEYGWGAVVDQSTKLAFATRDSILKKKIIEGGLLVALEALFIYLLLRIITIINTLRQRDKILLESIGDGVIVMDRFWKITGWNKTAGSLTGWTEKEALGKPFHDIVQFVRETDRKENIAFIEEAMLYGKVHFMQNHTLLIRKDGKEISVGDSAAPVFDQSGKVTGAIIVFRDVTKEHEQEKARSEFASLATHQLRSPINVIRGYSEMLTGNEPVSPTESKSALLEIHKACKSLSELVNAMLNVSRIETGTIAINPEPTYIPDITDDVIKEIVAQIEAKKLQLEKQYATDIPSINADPKLVSAIFMNLLTNAIKYTPNEGKIIVKIEKQGENILIAVADTGIGIPKDQQSKLFTKFFRADNVSEGSEGTGLGLYIVKSILEQSGGKLWFESQENQGTVFYVTIPLAGMKKKEGLKGLT